MRFIHYATMISRPPYLSINTTLARIWYCTRSIEAPLESQWKMRADRPAMDGSNGRFEMYGPPTAQPRSNLIDLCMCAFLSRGRQLPSQTRICLDSRLITKGKRSAASKKDLDLIGGRASSRVAGNERSNHRAKWITPSTIERRLLSLSCHDSPPRQTVVTLTLATDRECGGSPCYWSGRRCSARCWR